MEVRVDVKIKEGDKIIERLNRAGKLIQELSSIVTDLRWYGIKLELTSEKLSAEPKNSTDSEK